MNPEGMCACAFAVLAVAAEQLAARVDARTQFTTRRVTEIFQKGHDTLGDVSSARGAEACSRSRTPSASERYGSAVEIR